MKHSQFKKISALLLMPALCCFLASCNKEPQVEYLTANNQNTQSMPISPALQSIEDDEKTVVVAVENYGRMDPFMPYSEKTLSVSTTDKFSDVPLPPSLGEADPALQELIKAKVTGILYDKYKPSAIVNIMGQDQLVRKGDSISGFYIENINKDFVVIKSGFNTYKAGIGEIIDGTINNSNINNLQSRFAGARASSDDTIQIRSVNDRSINTSNKRARS